MRLVPLATLLLIFAGCVQPADPGLDPAAATDVRDPTDPLGGFPDPLMVAHDHADLDAHSLFTPTMEALAHVDFADQPGVAFAELDFLGENHLVVSGLLNGFFILDITDRAAPRVVSYTPDAGFLGDAKASESGDFVFIGVQLSGFVGIKAYNVMVPERPVLAGTYAMDNGCHMLAVHEGHLYCAPNDATVRILEIVETPVGVALVPKSVYAPAGAPATPVTGASAGSGEFTHDMTVQLDPLTNTSVMYVSFWDMGMHAVDVEDPANPAQLGVWLGEGGGEVYEGNIHTSMASLVDGRRVIATLPEYALAPSVTFLDATDYGNMTVLGVWTPKAGDDYEGESRQFSTHNFQFVGGRVYVAMYHGGVWVLDASTVEAVESPRALGYALPAAVGGALGRASSLSIWDVVLKDGHLYASDMASGVHVLRYVEDELGDAARTSFA